MRNQEYVIPDTIRLKRAREAAVNSGETRVVLGKGMGNKGSINLFDVKGCDPNCDLARPNRTCFECNKHNLGATVLVRGGSSRTSIDEFKQVAPCTQTSGSTSTFSHRLQER